MTQIGYSCVSLSEPKRESRSALSSNHLDDTGRAVLSPRFGFGRCDRTQFQQPGSWPVSVVNATTGERRDGPCGAFSSSSFNRRSSEVAFTAASSAQLELVEADATDCRSNEVRETAIGVVDGARYAKKRACANGLVLSLLNTACSPKNCLI